MTKSYPRAGRRDWPIDWTLAEEPLGAALVRDGIANNALHAADQACAQVLVSWACPVLALTQGNAEDRILTMSADLKWERIAAFGPMRLSTMIQDGARNAYTLRVAMAGAAEDQAQFAALVTRPGAMPILLDESEIVSGDRAVIYTCTSSVPAWLTPDGPGYIMFTPASIEAYMRTIDTLTEPGGEASSAITAQVEIGVFVRSDDIGAFAEVVALHIAEVWT
jgi:hypothetical protein